MPSSLSTNLDNLAAQVLKLRTCLCSSGKWDWLRANCGHEVKYDVVHGACPTFRGLGASSLYCRQWRQSFRIVALLIITVLGQQTFAKSAIDQQLKNAIEPLVREHQGEIGLAVRSLDSDVHYEFNANTPMPTASLIKLPILIAAYRMADVGDLGLGESIRLRQTDKVPGSGILTEHFSNDIDLPLRDYIRLMIRNSDNTATNVVVDRIGLRTTADTMSMLRMENTKLHSKVYRADTTVFPQRSKRFGIGSTTANEMVTLLVQLESGKLASSELTDAMRQHLLSCDDRSKIAAGIPQGIEFAHKTGAIANCRTDAGIIYTPAGPVAICFLSNKNEDQSWSGDNDANVLAAKIGKIIVERFGAPATDNQLREGAFGTIVESLQRTLNRRLKPSPDLAIDGDFGPATRSAVARFQRSQKIEVTGVVSELTWKALGTLTEEDDPVLSPQLINSEQLSVIPQAAVADPPIVTANAWAIADATTGEIVSDFNSDAALEAASTTKIMTTYLVLRYAEQHPKVFDEIVEFSLTADNTVGSTTGLRAGERVSVRELLFGLMLPSGNDAAVAFAEHFGARLAPDEPPESATPYDTFIVAMNAMAKELGMQQTQYANPHGLSDEAHVISAADLIRLSHEAMKSELFQTLASTRQFGCTVRGIGGYKRNVVWKNTNELLEIQGYSGIKTGTTSAAGACLVAVGERANDKLLVVVLGASSSAARYADIRNLFRWAWQTREAAGK